jgi:hypothetical protein
MSNLISAVALLLLSFCATSSADIFKCKNQSGQIEFSDKPCVAGSSSAQKLGPISNNTLDSSAERRLLHNQQLNTQEPRSSNRPVTAQAANKTGTSPCAQAKQDWQEAKKNAQCWATKDCETDLTRERAKQVDRFCNQNVDEMSSTQIYNAAERKKEAEQNVILTNCDTAGCWGTNGSRYNAAGGTTFVGPRGACVKTGGNTLSCP